MNKIRASLIPGRGGRWRGCAIFSLLLRSSHLLWSTVSKAVPLTNKESSQRKRKRKRTLCLEWLCKQGWHSAWHKDILQTRWWQVKHAQNSQSVMRGVSKLMATCFRVFSSPQFLSLKIFNSQAWENFKKAFYTNPFSKRDTNAGEFHVSEQNHSLTIVLFLVTAISSIYCLNILICAIVKQFLRGTKPGNLPL